MLMSIDHMVNAPGRVDHLGDHTRPALLWLVKINPINQSIKESPLVGTWIAL